MSEGEREHVLEFRDQLQGHKEFKDTLVRGQGCRHSGAALQSQVVRSGQGKQQEACVCAEQ